MILCQNIRFELIINIIFQILPTQKEIFITNHSLENNQNQVRLLLKLMKNRLTPWESQKLLLWTWMRIKNGTNMSKLFWSQYPSCRKENFVKINRRMGTRDQTLKIIYLIMSLWIQSEQLIQMTKMQKMFSQILIFNC